MNDPESCYFEPEVVRARVAAGQHRELVGGLWNAMGELQFEFLKNRGLRPEHRLLDIGCGCLRGGVHFVRYLELGNYYGVDISQELLNAGIEELIALGLDGKLVRENLFCSGSFEVDAPSGTFDFALAQSLFTHLTFNRIRECLERIAPQMRSGGVLYASFFELPSNSPVSGAVRHEPAGVITSASSDPYHYRFADFCYAAAGLPWRVQYFGDWGHPRGQRMLAFVRI